MSIEIVCDTPGATIYYTLDGREPVPGGAMRYAQPLYVTSTKCIRASAHRAGWRPSPSVTHTYIVNANDTLKGLPIHLH